MASGWLKMEDATSEMLTVGGDNKYLEMMRAEKLRPAELRAFWEGEWPPGTMDSDAVRRNRRCPYGGGRHDCECCGKCPYHASR